jgi:hypothetical protein
MWGESQSENSWASAMMPTQSALEFPETGGGEGQERNGLLPETIASMNTLTSKTAGIALLTPPSLSGCAG